MGLGRLSPLVEVRPTNPLTGIGIHGTVPLTAYVVAALLEVDSLGGKCRGPGNAGLEESGGSFPLPARLAVFSFYFFLCCPPSVH